MSDTAKIFMNGHSQAVRLPAAYRFDVDEVFVRRDERTGDVILSRRPGTSFVQQALLPFAPPRGPLSVRRGQREGQHHRDDRVRRRVAAAVVPRSSGTA